MSEREERDERGGDDAGRSERAGRGEPESAGLSGRGGGDGAGAEDAGRKKLGGAGADAGGRGKSAGLAGRGAGDGAHDAGREELGGGGADAGGRGRSAGLSGRGAGDGAHDAGREELGGAGAEAGGRGESAGLSEPSGRGAGSDAGADDAVAREERSVREAAADEAASARPRGLSRLPAPARVVVSVLGPFVLTTAYFVIPFGVLGPHHRILSWLILAGLLALLAVGMVVTTSRALTDTAGRYRHPGLGILLLSWAAILVFAASYWAMATRHGQFVGLQTRLDALYFTGVTMATVGYGDVHPSGQAARAVVLVQLVYTFAFLVSGITALRTRARATVARRLGGGK